MRAGVVLVGSPSGPSDREWHGTTLGRWTAAILARAVERPVVVVESAVDAHPRTVLARLTDEASRAEVAFVCSADRPFLHPAVVRRISSLLGDADAAVPVVGGCRDPHLAAYRLSTRGRPESVRELAPEVLLEDRAVARHDPELRSLRRVTTDAEYAAARAEAPPAISVHVYGALLHQVRRHGGHDGGHVAAATVGAAAAELGLELGLHVVAALNGERISKDPETPLVAGDSLAFLSADAGG